MSGVIFKPSVIVEVFVGVLGRFDLSGEPETGNEGRGEGFENG